MYLDAEIAEKLANSEVKILLIHSKIYNLDMSYAQIEYNKNNNNKILKNDSFKSLWYQHRIDIT